MARDQALINTDCLAELIYVSAVDPWAMYPVNVPYRPGAPRGQSFLSLELIYVYVLYILSGGRIVVGVDAGCIKMMKS